MIITTISNKRYITYEVFMKQSLQTVEIKNDKLPKSDFDKGFR